MTEIPADIAMAVEELLAQQSSVQGYVVDASEWRKTSPFIDSLVPECYKLLLHRYPLAGRLYEIDEEHASLSEIGFWEPRHFENVTDGGGLIDATGLILADDPDLWPFCGIPDGYLIAARGREFHSAEVFHYCGGFGIDATSEVNDSLCGFLQRLWPSDWASIIYANSQGRMDGPNA